VDYLEREIELIDSTTTKIKTWIGKLRERRSSLLSAAVTGKIDVRTLVN
jgi:type I restriction enzyme S subunit